MCRRHGTTYVKRIASNGTPVVGTVYIKHVAINGDTTLSCRCTYHKLLCFECFGFESLVTDGTLRTGRWNARSVCDECHAK